MEADGNPYRAPDAFPTAADSDERARRAGEDPPGSGRRFRYRLIPAVICGLFGLLNVVTTAAGILGVVPLVAEHGLGPVLEHPLVFSGLGLFGAGGVAWLASAWAWSHRRWRIAIVGTALAIGFQQGAHTVIQDLQEQDDTEAHAWIVQAAAELHGT